MYLEIDGERTIAAVQKDFSSFFPFLKIEFFRNGSPIKRYTADLRLHPQTKLKDAWRKTAIAGRLPLSETMTVLELEKALQENFGLEAQVFRKSGNLWLETTMTDSWTLQRQNTHGSELSFKKSDGRKSDFDLDRDSDH